MKYITVEPYLVKGYEVVSVLDCPLVAGKRSLCAVFDVEHEVFLGLVSSLDVAMSPEKSFAELLKFTKNTTTVPPTITLKSALSIMKKEKKDVLAVLDQDAKLLGVVYASDLVAAQLKQTESVLKASEAKVRLLNREAKQHQKAIIAAKIREDTLLYHDQLTGLPNLPHIRKIIRNLNLRAKQKQVQGALLLIDIDNFKDVNEARGSDIGDIILKQIAERLLSLVSAQDALARKCADEFIVILWQVDSVNRAAQVAKRIIKGLSEPFTVGEQSVYLSASVGIALYPDNVQSTEDLLTKADIALETVKKTGKQNYQIFHTEMGEKRRQHQDRQYYLRHSIEQNELELRYQPQVDIRDNRLIGMEALLRWNNPKLGRVYPEQFIYIAEQTGLIIPIGEWVLKTACQEAKKWNDSGSRVRIAVNLSARQLQTDSGRDAKDMITFIDNLLKETEFPREQLELEVTESILMTNSVRVIDVIRGLKNIGIRIACDDFGTGYSSLRYLKCFPFDSIKIDKSFIADIPTDQDTMAIIQAIISLAQQLKILVIAEGVETKEQLKALQELGCDVVQGFYFSKPLTTQAAKKLIEKNIKDFPT